MGGSCWPCSAFPQEFLWLRSRVSPLAAGNKRGTWFHGSSSPWLEEGKSRGLGRTELDAGWEGWVLHGSHVGNPPRRDTGMHDVLVEASLLRQAHLQLCEMDLGTPLPCPGKWSTKSITKRAWVKKRGSGAGTAAQHFLKSCACKIVLSLSPWADPGVFFLNGSRRS